MKQEQVNHPLHYNQHPNGIECIDIIRHYTCDIANALKYLWRAGLKVPSKREQYQTRLSIAECEETRPIGQTEMDKAAIEREKSDAGIGSSERELTRLKVKEDAEKEIEDLKKALWYIEDYRKNILPMQKCRIETYYRLDAVIIKKVTGYEPHKIAEGYQASICHAMQTLLRIGIINGRTVCCPKDADNDLQDANEDIQERILDITAAQESAETAAVSAASPAEYDENIIHFL